MAPGSSPAGASANPAIRRALVGLTITLVVAIGVVAGALAVSGGLVSSSAGPTPGPSGSATATVTASPSLPPTPEPSLGPTPEPTPVLVPSALTGLPVTETAARRHPIAVMVDDLAAARPQSGFNAAAIVWQAPAEGGIPRYMMIFQDQVPAKVGPVRSSREYFIEWAAEWRAMYVHHGGSPQALSTLASHGSGQYVWNADGFRWSPTYLYRVDHVTVPGGKTYPLVPPHNLYTDGSHLRKLAARIGADDGPLTPVWTFGAASGPQDRPSGTTITVTYEPYESIQYRYDPTTNTYRRYTAQSGQAFKAQVDAGDGKPVAPTNVVILKMAFGPLNDGHYAQKHRLEAQDVGHGTAWISSNGITVKGTWRKASITAPTLLFGPDGSPITLAPGQTFVQVMKLTDSVKLKAGTFPGASQVPSPLPS